MGVSVELYLTGVVAAIRGGVAAKSASCECILKNNCTSARPVLRMNIRDDQLKYFSRQYHHYVYDYNKSRRMRDKQLPHREWFFKHQDQDYLDSHDQFHIHKLSRSILQHVHSSCNSPGKQIIYLTYDDGIYCEEPTCGRHYDFLDMADWLDVKVSLFVSTLKFVRDQKPSVDGRGHYHEKAKEVLTEYERRGHVIGSHTHTHPSLGRASKQNATDDIQKAHVLLQNLSLSGQAPVHFRAPHLSVSDWILGFLVNNMGYTVWGGVNGGGVDWEEWELPSDKRRSLPEKAAEIVRYYYDKKEFSMVFTLHDRPHTLRALPLYVRQICRVCPGCEFHGLHTTCTSAPRPAHRPDTRRRRSDGVRRRRSAARGGSRGKIQKKGTALRSASFGTKRSKRRRSR